jgi:hypothetical protein
VPSRNQHKNKNKTKIIANKKENLNRQKYNNNNNNIKYIFGPLNIDNIWRIRNNTEIDKLIEGAYIVKLIKAQRIKWLGHIQRMDQTRPTRKLLDRKPMGTRPVGRPRLRRQEDVVEDVKKLKVKPGRRHLRIEELGETWLRRRKPTKVCSAK